MPSPFQVKRVKVVLSLPSFFVLTLEPLLRRLRLNPDIKRVAYMLAAFADDFLLFLTDPHVMIPKLLKDFSLFKTLTNLPDQFFQIPRSECLTISRYPVPMQIQLALWLEARCYYLPWSPASLKTKLSLFQKLSPTFENHSTGFAEMVLRAFLL